MSGGSFAYLFADRGGDVRQKRGTVDEMRDEVVALGDVPGAAAVLADLDALLALIDRPDPVDAVMERLAPVLKAIEWWRSSDWSRESAMEELAKYPVAPPTANDRDLIERLRELVEPAIAKAADTGQAQAVDVTALFAGDDPAAEHLALVQRAIDAAVWGTAMTGYAAAFRAVDRGQRLAAVIRGVGR